VTQNWIFGSAKSMADFDWFSSLSIRQFPAPDW